MKGTRVVISHFFKGHKCRFETSFQDSDICVMKSVSRLLHLIAQLLIIKAREIISVKKKLGYFKTSFYDSYTCVMKSVSKLLHSTAKLIIEVCKIISAKKIDDI